MASVVSVEWSTDISDIGKTVTLTAYLSGVKEAATVAFRVIEFSGPQIATKTVATMQADVAKDDTMAQVSWVVEPVQDDLGSGVPEFKGQASIGSKRWVSTGSTLRIGDVLELKWIHSKGSRLKLNPNSKFQIVFRDSRTIWMQARINRLNDFVVVFLVYRSVKSGNGKIQYIKLDEVKDIPIIKGIAKAPYILDTLNKPELRESVLYFEVLLKHPESHFSCVPTKHRSLPAKHYPRRMWFSLYYTNERTVWFNAFRKASDHWTDSVPNAKDWKGPDSFIVRKPFTELCHIFDGWREIYEYANKRDAVIMEGHVFSHASSDGILLPVEDLYEKDVKVLEKMPWQKTAQLVLHGCCTGLKSTGECIAKVFADAQNVETIGQAGKSYFSENDPYFSYFTSFAERPEVYLWAYERRENVEDGRMWGKKLNGISFKPSRQ